MTEQERKTSPEVKEFANALNEWAAGRPDRELLLRWLLSRCESRGFKGPCRPSEPESPEKDKYVIERRNIRDIDIPEAVMRAMVGYNPDLPTSGWVRGGPIWPKAYGDIWPKAYGS